LNTSQLWPALKVISFRRKGCALINPAAARSPHKNRMRFERSTSLAAMIWI
jgi:hypothetical protein